MKIKSYVIAIILCLFFLMTACKKSEKQLVNVNATTVKTGSNAVEISETSEGKEILNTSTTLTTALTDDKSLDVNNEKTTYVPRTAEQWGVKMPKMKLIPDDPYSVKLYDIYTAHINTPYSFIEAFSKYDECIDEAIYDLYDLDGDGTKELITGCNRYEGEYVGWLGNYNRIEKGRKKMVTHIYSINDEGNLTEWQFYGNDYGGMQVNQVILSDGTIKTLMGDAYGNDDHYGCKYVKLKAGKITAYRVIFKDNEYSTISERDNPDANYKITQEEFFKIKDEWEKDNPEVKLDWQPIHTYGKNQG